MLVGAIPSQLVLLMLLVVLAMQHLQVPPLCALCAVKSGRQDTLAMIY